MTKQSDELRKELLRIKREILDLVDRNGGVMVAGSHDDVQREKLIKRRKEIQRSLSDPDNSHIKLGHKYDDCGNRIYKQPPRDDCGNPIYHEFRRDDCGNPIYPNGYDHSQDRAFPGNIFDDDDY